MKTVSIKRWLAIALAVLLMLPNRIVIAAEDQVSEVVAQQEDCLSRDTEEVEGSKEGEIPDKETILDEAGGLDKEGDLDKEDDLDKEKSPPEESAGDQGADCEIKDPPAESEFTEEVEETPADQDNDGDEEDPVEDELSDIEVGQEQVAEKPLKAIEQPIQALALEEEDEIITGTCGDGLTWSLDRGSGILQINGTGDMDDFLSGATPWDEGDRCNIIKHIVIEDGVTSIGNGAFMSFLTLESIKIANSVTYIGDGAFYGCLRLESMEMSDSVIYIGEHAFQSCHRLTNIEIPNGMEHIGFYTFYDCRDLSNVKIPEGVKSIEDNAFAGCCNLTSLKLPNSIEKIGKSAFESCTGLTSLELPENIVEIGFRAFSRCSGLKNIKIQNGVSNVGDAVFEGCSSLTEIDIPGSIEYIRAEAFANCDSLENVNLSEGISEIYASAFQCADLMSIVIPASVGMIGAQAFGYYFDHNTSDIERNDGFIIMGISGSAAERYAIDNDFTFIALDTLVDPIITTTDIPVGVRYAPYEALIENSSIYSWNTVTYSLVDGALPPGIDLDSQNGRLYGVPMGTGTSTFTVRMENSFSRFPDREKTFSITTIDNTDRNVADYTDSGYEITQRVQDMTIDLAYDQTVVSRGSFDEFTTVFIDGVELVRNLDYTAEEGSTRITIMRQTFQRFASIGIHTISIEFRTRDKGLLKRAIQNYEIKATNSGNSSSGGGSGGHRDRGSSSDGAPANVIMVIFDPKKGYVHTVTGIIPREWAGYSHWVKDEKGWRLVYADGTEACGYMVEQADGDALEQVLWEMVEGAWYAFGADGYLKSGWVFDHQLSGWYCLSAEDGMHTGWYHDPQDDHDYYLDQTTGRISAGWRQIDGKWYYFKADITPPTWKFDKDTGTWAYDPMNINKPYGAMYHREWTPDRYYVDDDGVWDPNVGS